MKIYKYILVLIILPTLHACKTSKNSSSLSDQEKNKIFVYQNNEEQVISTESAEVNLSKEPFSIRFYNKQYNVEADAFYSTRIAAFRNEESIPSIESGTSTEKIPFFSPGSGMAPSETGQYDYLIFNDYGHHYLFYENESSKRAELLSNAGDFKKLEFDIKGYYQEGNPVELVNSKLDVFYLAVFSDFNLNKIIDEGEIHLLTIRLK